MQTQAHAHGLHRGPFSLLGACKDFFGLRADQKTSIEFGKEYKALTMQDRQDLKEMLEQEQGYVISQAAPGVPAEASHGAAA